MVKVGCSTELLVPRIALASHTALHRSKRDIPVRNNMQSASLPFNGDTYPIVGSEESATAGTVLADSFKL